MEPQVEDTPTPRVGIIAEQQLQAVGATERCREFG